MFRLSNRVYATAAALTVATSSYSLQQNNLASCSAAVEERSSPLTRRQTLVPPLLTRTTNPKLDYRLIPIPPPFKRNHAIYENILHENGISQYDVFRSPQSLTESSKELCVAQVSFGTKVNGHKGIVHGGIASLLFDDCLGFGYFIASKGLLGYTANLTINYKNPLPENSEVFIRVHLDKIERRKVLLTARLESRDGKTIYSEATALYIVDKSMKKMGFGDELDKLLG